MTKQPMSHSLRIAGLALAAGSVLAAGNVQAQDKGTVELGYVEWSSEVASTNVVRAVLEQAGYDVELTSLSAAAMWQAVASGDSDAIVAAWLPTTHADYLERVGDKVENLGPNLDGTKLGLVVPEYTDVGSIDELNANADTFNNKIIGIDPGAGLMGLTEQVVEEYGLDLDLQSGSGATMTAALQSAIQNEEDVVVTGWTPHWMFARWDLKYLDDPKNVYGGAEHINTIVRQGLKKDMPEAYAILDAFEWTPEQMGEVMLMNQEEGSDPYENAKQWVEDNQDVVQEWLPES
ncbi:glycine betaine ABC transporter substrate-binding protein [Halomonas elongata]|uniref:Glycine betaine/carnitine transport binding protein GbuC n=2 Tax=Halomonas elongata TaxID=2746 RepID=A0A1B8NZH4_HALEL|nr:glycine betaine ABC transporter substrate-binding protein [Halomonas elongata]MBW5800257.1 glycine betaine ABC transporter substrate-binding protein [Halomonas elongata]MDL4863814.1 glycine betaine ABC transporter substrate-binding protein [Halomonas elongata]OBX35370.1 glycine betaine/carnitine transport binding protein GbuC precursor [Halomonas elongata]RAW07082.1 glycine/betaine ABC transporter substrate-binding protein [Halomonas elongata]WBF18038.1 glycine betaine ABC transporter subst